jgi:N-acetyl-1-D-myo-inositol-2-amino-2-deoxy-alpha-D-glucopyranoside deacetylase
MNRPTLPLPLPNGPRSRIVGVFAHPDDEAYFAGAALATYAAAGCEVRLVTLTGGEAFGPARLRQYASACAALGVTDSRQLRPGTWQDLGRAGAANSLAAAPLVDVVAAVRDFLAETRPDVLITNDADGVTGHPDHVRMYEAVMAGRGTVPVVLGGCVRADDVEAASRRLGSLAPGVKLGSGGVRGVCGDGLLAFEPTVPAWRARAAALDIYDPLLGTGVLEDLVAQADRVGDGIVLRTVSDLAGHREFFRVL